MSIIRDPDPKHGVSLFFYKELKQENEELLLTVEHLLRIIEANAPNTYENGPSCTDARALLKKVKS